MFSICVYSLISALFLVQRQSYWLNFENNVYGHIKLEFWNRKYTLSWISFFFLYKNGEKYFLQHTVYNSHNFYSFTWNIITSYIEAIKAILLHFIRNKALMNMCVPHNSNQNAVTMPYQEHHLMFNLSMLIFIE